MKRSIFIFACLIFLFAFDAEARRKTKVLRGGLGFLYQDFNGFMTNPGQLSLNQGTGVEVQYAQTSVSGSTLQSVTPTIAHATGRLGVGVFANRLGSGLDSDSSADSVGGALGFSLGRRRQINLGVSYLRSLESTTTDSGQIGGTLNLNPSRGSGVSAGIGVSTVLGASSSVIAATAGLGYAGRNRNNNIEANISFDDISNTDDFSVGAIITLGDKHYYFSGAYIYSTAPGTTSSDVSGRLGVVMGRGGAVDLSVFSNYRLETGSNPSWGVTLRANL